MEAAGPTRLRWPFGLASSDVAWIAWGTLLVVVSVMTVVKLHDRPHEPLANGSEEHAANNWWCRGDLYRPLEEPYFLYLPHAAILYTPFTVGPPVVRHLVVRAFYVTFFLAALSAFAGIGDPERQSPRLLLMTFVCLPLATDSIRAAQANLPLAAALMLASVAIARGRWNWGAAALLLAVAIKPLGIVGLLLAGGMWPRRLGWRLALGAVVLAAAPFAFGPPAYVMRQYGDFLHTMMIETDPARNFSDIRGFLAFGFGIELSNGTLLLVRAAAALATLGIALVARLRWDRNGAALALYVLAAAHLMLVNPKTEGPTYTILGPAIGVLFAWAVLDLRSVVLSVLLGAVAYGIALTYEIWGPHQYVWQPTLTLVFSALAILTILAGRWSRGGCPWVPRPARANAGAGTG